MACQIPLRQSDYGFLVRNSFLDCSQLYPFTNDELMFGLGTIPDTTKAEIKRAVSAAKTIEKRYRDLILSS